MNQIKSSTFVMLAGKVLPPYIVFKAEHMWDSWCNGGPKMLDTTDQSLVSLIIHVFLTFSKKLYFHI